LFKSETPITDKSVDTFEQNRRFLSASFRNWKTPLFLSIAKPGSPPVQCWNTLRGHCHLVTTLKWGEGVEMWKFEIEKLTRSTKQVFFGKCLSCLCPWLSLWPWFATKTEIREKYLNKSHCPFSGREDLWI